MASKLRSLSSGVPLLFYGVPECGMAVAYQHVSPDYAVLCALTGTSSIREARKRWLVSGKLARRCFECTSVAALWVKMFLRKVFK